MLALMDKVKNSTQLRWNRVHRFKAKIDLFIEVGPYIVKTAETYRELVESFKLRHEVFHNEFRGVEGPGLDFDKYDYHFDHLIILHKPSNKIIGTYRLNCSTFSNESYTALEFDLTGLMKEKGPFLELGRACIAKDFRKGSVISLLWRGIAEYMNLCGAEILFGCSSLKIDNPRDAALAYKYLVDEKMVKHEFLCRPTKKYRMNNFDTWYSYLNNGYNDRLKAEAEELIPSLVRSYLKLGAVVACEPAFDAEFDCIDLLTILKKEDLASSLVQKFQIVR
ncbi:MAG: GNAT family N-acyltransferase [Bdellovibrionota bacterium]